MGFVVDILDGLIGAPNNDYNDINTHMQFSVVLSDHGFLAVAA